MDEVDRVGAVDNKNSSAVHNVHSVHRVHLFFLFFLATLALANHFYFNLYTLWNQTLTDFHVYHEALLHAQRGVAVYQLESPMPFLYPPFFLIVLWPLGWLGEPVAMQVWLIAQSVFLFVALAALLRVFRPLDRPAAMLSVVLFGFFSPVMLNCLYGQANLLHLALLSLFALAYQRSYVRRKDSASDGSDRSDKSDGSDGSDKSDKPCEWLAALALSIAISIRVAPLGLLALAAIQRRWRIVAVTLLLVAVEALIAGLVVGFDAEWHYFTSCMFHLRRPANMREISLLALYEQGLPPRAAAILFWTTVGAGLAVFAAFVLRPMMRRAPTPALHVAFVIVSMVLFSPLVEYHHYVLLLAPLVLVLGYLRARGQLTLTPALLLFAAWAIVSIGNKMSHYQYPAMGFVALAGALLLWVQIVVLIVRGRTVWSPERLLQKE